MKLVLFIDGDKKDELKLENHLKNNYKIVHTTEGGIELLKGQNNLTGHDWKIFLYVKSKIK